MPMVFWRVSVLRLAKRHTGIWATLAFNTGQPPLNKACVSGAVKCRHRRIAWSSQPGPGQPRLSPRRIILPTDCCCCSAPSAGDSRRTSAQCCTMRLSMPVLQGSGLSLRLRPMPGSQPSSQRSRFEILSKPRSPPSLLLPIGIRNTKHLNEGKRNRTGTGQSSDMRLVTCSILVTN